MTREDTLAAAKTLGLNFVLFASGTPESAFASLEPASGRLMEMDPHSEDGELELYRWDGVCVMTNGVGEDDEDEGEDGPDIGDRAVMPSSETAIEIWDVPDEQPEANSGVFIIVDQYGETHRVEGDGDGIWEVIVPTI